MDGWEMVTPVAKWVPSKIFGPYRYFGMEEREPVRKRRGDSQCACLLGCLTLFCVFGVSVRWWFSCWEDLGAAAA